MEIFMETISISVLDKFVTESSPPKLWVPTKYISFQNFFLQSYR